MNKNIIGIPNNNSGFRTNILSSEKFTCQAMKDAQKKKEKQHQLLKSEIDRRINEE